MLIQLWNQQGGSHSGELGRCALYVASSAAAQQPEKELRGVGVHSGAMPPTGLTRQVGQQVWRAQS